MSIGFQEFLRRKAGGSDFKERLRNREEWLRSLNRLFHQIQEWLLEADPEHLIQIFWYEVQRAEEHLGVYDAPALKIRVGLDDADVLPVGRFDIGPISYRTAKGFLDMDGSEVIAAGRVDITDGDRKYLLLRGVKGDQESWYSASRQSGLTLFDRTTLETFLQDLLG